MRKSLHAFLALAWITIGCVPTPIDPTTTATPIVSGFEPTSGKEGDVVTITGSNFSTTMAGNVVKFNGVTASVTAATATSVQVEVPAGDITGQITLTVDAQTGTSTDNFTGRPSISSFFPPAAPPGRIVTILGSHFRSDKSLNAVSFNGAAAVVSTATHNRLEVIVPDFATTGEIQVTASGIAAVAAPYFSVSCALLSVATISTAGDRTITYTTNNKNQVTQITIVGSSAGTTTYTYDDHGRLIGSVRTLLGGSPSQTVYAYNDLNQISTAATGANIVYYTYNASGQLTRVGNHATTPTIYTDYTYPNTSTRNYTSINDVSPSGSTLTSFLYDDKPRINMLYSQWLPENNWTRQTQNGVNYDIALTYTPQGYASVGTLSGGWIGSNTYTYDCD